jgi:hypothetical protein
MPCKKQIRVRLPAQQAQTSWPTLLSAHYALHAHTDEVSQLTALLGSANGQLLPHIYALTQAQFGQQPNLTQLKAVAQMVLSLGRLGAGLSGKALAAEIKNLSALAEVFKTSRPQPATASTAPLSEDALALTTATETLAHGLEQLRVYNYRGQTFTREQALAGLTGAAADRVLAGLNLIDALSERGARGSFGLLKSDEVAQRVSAAFLANPELSLDSGIIPQLIKILNLEKSQNTAAAIGHLNALKAKSVHISDSSENIINLINSTNSSKLKTIPQNLSALIKTTLQEALNSGRIVENRVNLYQDAIKKIEPKKSNKAPVKDTLGSETAIKNQSQTTDNDIKIPKNLNSNIVRPALTTAGKIDRILKNVDVNEPEKYFNPNGAKIKINSLEVSIVDRCRQVCDQIVKANLFNNISTTSAEPYDFDTIFHIFLVQENSDKDVIIDPTYRQFQFNHGINFFDFSPELDASERNLLMRNDFGIHLNLKVQEIIKRDLLNRPNVLVIEIPKLNSMLDRIKFIVDELNKYPEIPKWNHIFWIKGYIDLCKKKGFSGSMAGVNQVLADYKSLFENAGKDPELRAQKAGRDRKLIEYIRQHPEKDGMD